MALRTYCCRRTIRVVSIRAGIGTGGRDAGSRTGLGCKGFVKGGAGTGRRGSGKRAQEGARAGTKTRQAATVEDVHLGDILRAGRLTRETTASKDDPPRRDDGGTSCCLPRSRAPTAVVLAAGVRGHGRGRPGCWRRCWTRGRTSGAGTARVKSNKFLLLFSNFLGILVLSPVARNYRRCRR